jgi:putative transposase
MLWVRAGWLFVNGKFRAECLNAHWFEPRRCAANNEERAHSAIGNKAPIELIDRSVAYGPR